MAQDKPPGSSGNVDEWFARHEEELLRQARRERKRKEDEARAAAEKQRREAHWMKCPKCGDDLREIDVGAVKVDKCGACEGIFLDRGELEQIMLKQSDDRRGFFRKLLGFSASS